MQLVFSQTSRMDTNMHKTPKMFLLDNAFSMSAYWVCSGIIVAGITSYFNISVSTSNILAGLTSTLGLLQMPGGLIYSYSKNKNLIIRVLNILWRILLPLTFFTVLLPQNIGAMAFVIILPLMVGVLQLSMPSQTAWMVDAVEGIASPNYYSMREMSYMFYQTALLCICYIIIDISNRYNMQKQGFTLIGVFVSISILASFYVFAQLPNVKNLPEQSTQKQRFNLITIFKPVLQNKMFCKVMLVNIVWSFASMFVGTFSAVYQVRTLSIPFLSILIFGTVANIIRVFFSPVVQYISQKFSWQRACQLMMIIYIFGAGAWLFTTIDNFMFIYPISTILTTIPHAGLGVSFLQLQVSSMPKQADRTIYFSLLAMLNGVASLLGSAACSSLIGVFESTSSQDLRPIFAIGIIGITISVLLAQKLNMQNNNTKNRINEAISKIKKAYPNLKFEPLPTKKRNFFNKRK